MTDATQDINVEVQQDVKVAVQDPAGNNLYLYVQAVGEPGAMAGGEQEVAGGLPSLDRAFDTIQAVGNKVADAIKAVAPDKFTVELGFEFKAEAGGLVAMMVRSGGSASIKVTMEWDRDPRTPAGG